MKAKTRHRKSYKWRKRCDSSPIAKGRRAKIHGKRNPRKLKHLGGRGSVDRDPGDVLAQGIDTVERNASDGQLPIGLTCRPRFGLDRREKWLS